MIKGWVTKKAVRDFPDDRRPEEVAIVERAPVLHLLHAIETFPGSHEWEEWKADVERIANTIKAELGLKSND